MTDLLVCHPKDMYYPQWAWRMNRDRELFGRIVVVMTQTAIELDYTSYIGNHVSGSTVVINYPYDGKDWRNNAINEGLYETRGDKVLFLEQDFLVGEGFFEALINKAEPYDAVGFRDGERFHPACLLVTQDAIAKTRRDFSVDPDKGDHFSKFTQDLDKGSKTAELKDLGLPDWEHISGLTQNYRMTDHFHRPKEFYQYLVDSREYDQPDFWREITESKIKEVEREA
ncbi:MAG TPA: hypothetical protein ACFYD4_06160 [Candidatus Wunengus sp. YC61]|uniref:hypothetical protein n=1 Tax=Candidatus Wunengus sp. YC61 TaxID=3367698 RepID=UPI0040298929